MKYKIVEGTSSIKLAEKVNGSLEGNWKLYGDPIRDRNSGFWFQAMTLDNPDELLKTRLGFELG